MKRLVKTEIKICIDDEIPFKIPENWEWVRMESVVNFSIGKTPARKNSEYWLDPNIPWVVVKDLIDGETIYSSKEKINENGFKSYFKNKIVPKGTLLMCFKLSIGKISILGMDAVHNEAITSISPYYDEDYIFRDYLFCVMPLISQYGDIKPSSKGPTLNKKTLEKLLLPIPPLNEQKKIVNKINRLLTVAKGISAN